MGDAFWQLGQYNKSQKYYEKALEVSQLTNNIVFTAKQYSNIGYLQMEKGNHAEALKNIFKSNEICVKHNFVDLYLTNTAYVGQVFSVMGKLDEALKYYKEVELELLKKKNEIGLDAVYNNIGNIYSGKNNFKKAIYYYSKCLKMAEENNDEYNIAFMEYNIATNEFKSGKKVGVLKKLFHAYEVMRKHKAESTFIFAALGIGSYYSLTGSPDKGLPYIDTAYKHTLINGSKDLLLRCYKRYAEAYEIKRDFEKANYYIKNYFQLNDTIINQQFNQQLAKQTTSFNFDKKEFELKKVYAEKKAKDIETKSLKKSNTFILIILFLSLVSILIGIYYYSKLRKFSHIISDQKHLVEEKNREILDSITYAKRIQSAILPQPKLVKEFLEDSFVLYKPKDIVAGDFYWLEVVGEIVLFAAADCTGHGVPGAMVSVVCNNGLNRAVREHKLTEPDQILNKTRELVVEEFEKSDEEVKDGMDISLCALNTKTNTLKWAGANNPLWILRNGEIIENKGDKQPIGKHFDAKPFSLAEFQLDKNDIIYIFTDGFQDQFGGPKEKKFRAAQMKDLFLSLTSKTMEQQRKIIDTSFENWKGNLEQVDDVCIIGVRI
jgi:serine phosphatase RsbU (regulator of sigma subunit)